MPKTVENSGFYNIGGKASLIIRAEGQAGKAMMGQFMGNLLNVILDPVMILLFDWGIAGVAIATVIGNVFGAVYYIYYFLRGNSVLRTCIHRREMLDGRGILPPRKAKNCRNTLCISKSFNAAGR